MAGHSKWANIKRTKEREDAKRSKEFTKVSKEIEVVVRLTENGDPGSNPTLATLVAKAKSVNMPKDKIERAINRGLGIRSGEEDILLENTYEFYGPKGTTFLVDCETDNPNRTISELIVIGNRNGLKFANAGSISWAFRQVGEIVVEVEEERDIEADILDIMEIDGIIDIVRNGDKELNVLVEKEKQKEVYMKLNNKKINSAQLIKIPDNYVEIKDEDIEQLAEIEDNLQELQEVQNIWTNYKHE